MKCCWLILLLLIGGTEFSSLKAQVGAGRPVAARVDSLERALQRQARPDTNRVNALNELAAALLPGPALRVPALLTESEGLARRLGYPRGLAQAYQLQAQQALQAGRFGPAQEKALLSRALFRRAADSAGVGAASGVLGLILQQSGELEAATAAFTRQLRAARQPSQEAAGTANLGAIAKATGQNPQALQYFRQALRLYGRRPPLAEVAGIYSHMASAYANLHQLDSARYYCLQSLQTAQAGAAPRSEAVALSVLAKIEFVAGHHTQARDYLRQHIQLMQSLGERAAVAQGLKNMANVLNHLGDYQGAVKSSQEAIELMKLIGDKAGVKTGYDGLAAAMANLDRHEEAFNYQRLAEVYQDSVLEEASLKSMAEMQAKYETEKKEAQNRLQASQLREQQQVIRRRNTQLLAGGALALLLLGLAYLLYSRRQLRREVEFAQERQQLIQLRSQAVLEAEETERRRIGSDLHDGVGQLLTAAKMNLHALGEELNIQTEGQQLMLQNALDVVDESFREVRSISHNLMPNALIKRGLAQAVRDFLNKIGPDGRLKVQLEVVGLDQGGRLDPTVENVLFRVIQELVQNIVKHAQASQITLQIIRNPEELTIMVEDNGVGFDPAALGEEAGIGLKNIESRMAYLGGRGRLRRRFRPRYYRHPGSTTDASLNEE
jgi:two-component system NarL family sensor kinase